MYSKRIQEGVNSQDNKLLTTLLQNGSLTGIDEHKKLKILEEIVKSQEGNQGISQGDISLVKVYKF